MSRLRGDGRRGGALLAVMWLSIAMTAVAFAMSRYVRTEYDRASLSIDSTRAYFLAHGGVEAALRHLARPNARSRDGEGDGTGFRTGQRFMQFDFPTGQVEVEIIGESGKIDVNTAEPEVLARIIAATGIPGFEAVRIADGIVDYREKIRNGERRYGLSAADFSDRLGFSVDESAFSRSTTSIEEVEELTAVPGVTPNLLWGGYRENDEGRLIRSEGLMGALTTRGSSSVNANYASREMLIAAGLSEDEVEAIENLRRNGPLDRDDAGVDRLSTSDGPVRVGLGGQGDAYTVRATAELSGGRARRTVVALVEVGTSRGPDPVRIVRWYDVGF